jgi:hypothetical protein
MVKSVRARGGELADIGVGSPDVTEADAVTVRTLTSKQILGAFGAKIEPIRASIVYRTWVVIVAVVMFLLPLIYVGLIGLVSAGVYYHAV